MALNPSPRHPRLVLLASVLLMGFAVAARAGQARGSQLEAALAANQGNAAVQRCLQNEPAIDAYQRAVMAIERSSDPKVPAKFNCSGIGASWQEVGPAACCSAFERDKSGNVDAAWIALQQCGWRAEVEKRRPAYAQAANKCLAAAGADVAPPTPSPAGGRQDAWRTVPSFDQIKPQILGKDACAITGGPAWSVFDNAGRQRGLPGVLADRVQRGFVVLDDRGWLQAALATVRGGPDVDEALAQMARGGPDPAKQFVWFGDTFVRHYLPNASLWVPVGRDVDLAPAAATTRGERQLQLASSEHGSVRGTCNGGGDFIRFDPRSPVDPVTAPHIVLAAWPASGPAAGEPDVRVELPSAVVTADGGTARVVVDLAPSGAAAVLVIAGQVQVRESMTGSSQRVRGGDAVLVWPGAGVSSPVAASGARLVRATRPRIRGSIVLRPGERWSGPLRLDGVLPIEARLLYEKPAGSAYALEIAINGRPLADPPMNKRSPMRYADGRNYPYLEPNSARWMLFSSPDYEANNSSAGGGYEVMTDRGEAYRFVWNVAPLLGGQSTAQVQFRNGVDPGGPSLELRLLPADGVGMLTAMPPASPTPGTEAKKPGGWLQGLVDAAKDALKKPSTPAGGSQTAAVDTATVAPAGVARLVMSVAPNPVLAATSDEELIVFVQAFDAAGNPIPSKDAVAITLSSSNPSVLRPYGSDGHLAQVRANGLGRYGRFVSPAAGTATVTATAPGFAPASVSVRAVALSSRPAATLKLHAVPSQVAAGENAYLVAQFLDAQGSPTLHGKRISLFVEASSPTMKPAREETLFYGDTHTAANVSGRVSTQPGTTTLRATAGAFTSDAVEVIALAPSSSVPAPVGTSGLAVPRPAAEAPVIRNRDFGEPAVTGRISNIVTARGVRNGVAVDITDTFTPDVNPIHVWFRIAGFAPGTTLTSRWAYLGGAQPLVIGTADFVIAPTNDYGTFSYELAEGKRWPAGEYRIEILRDGAVAGSAAFTVTR